MAIQKVKFFNYIIIICFYFMGCGGGSSSSTTQEEIPSTDSESLVNTLSKVESKTINGTVYYSSSKIEVSWNTPAFTVDHYEILTTDTLLDITNTITVANTLTTTIISDLKAGTTYSIEVVACKSSNSNIVSDSTKLQELSTSEEYWLLEGSGNTYSTVTKIFEQSSTAASTVHYGSEAGSSLMGKVRLYCNSSPIKFFNTLGLVVDPGMFPSTSNSVINSSSDDYLAYSPDTDFGLRDPDTDATLISRILTYQVLPIATSGGKMRAYFEARDLNDITRLFYIDSVDGYTGLDFNPSSSSLVQEPTDWDSLATVAIGVDTDANKGGSGLAHVRQSKIGFPVLDSWIWDDSQTSFMVITGANSSGTITN